MEFRIHDDETSYFSRPEQLETVYGELNSSEPVSLAVVLFHRAGESKGIPADMRGNGSVQPLRENRELVTYPRHCVSTGKFEVMLHGYHDDETDGRPEFVDRDDLQQRVSQGRKYLEDLLARPFGFLFRPETPFEPQVCVRSRTRAFDGNLGMDSFIRASAMSYEKRCQILCDASRQF